MTIAKQQILELIKDLPEEVDIEEIIYRLYLSEFIAKDSSRYAQIQVKSIQDSVSNLISFPYLTKYPTKYIIL
ncbi:MAG: hypothetical protein HXY47_04100 [Nitrospirae bacterium]|nr:hypothetical protein [Nitrospirota bacterium]